MVRFVGEGLPALLDGDSHVLAPLGEVRKTFVSLFFFHLFQGWPASHVRHWASWADPALCNRAAMHLAAHAASLPAGSCAMTATWEEALPHLYRILLARH